MEFEFEFEFKFDKPMSHLMTRWMTPAFITALLALLTVEATTRLTMRDFFAGRYTYGFDERSGFVDTTDGQVRFARTGGRRFYAQQVSRTKPERTFRIVTVGDSIAHGASLEESYSGLLGELLRRAGYRVESLNLAVPGFGVRRQQIILQRALELEPDLVILHFGLSNEFEDERDWKRLQQANPWHPSQWLLHSHLIARLHEYRNDQLLHKFLPERIRQIGALSDAEDESSANRDPARLAVWRGQFDETLPRSLQLIEAAGACALLVPRVMLRSEGGQTRLDDGGLEAMLTGRLGPRARWLQPARVFGEHPDPAGFAKDTVHWHPPTHARFAQALADGLSSGSLPIDETTRERLRAARSSKN